MANDTVGDMMGMLADDQLQEERQLKESMAQRATNVISTSGTLVTLALGAAALVTQQQNFKVSDNTLAEVAAAVTLFILAIIASMLVNGVWTQRLVPVETLRSDIYKGTWTTVDDDKVRQVHDIRLDLIVQLRTANRWRARLLILALSLECCAILALAVATLEILLQKRLFRASAMDLGRAGEFGNGVNLAFGSSRGSWRWATNRRCAAEVYYCLDCQVAACRGVASPELSHALPFLAQLVITNSLL